MVCDIENRDCMLHSCPECPGKEALHEDLLKIFSDCEFDEGDHVTYKKWVHTDKTTLVSLQTSMTEFLDIICDSMDKLRDHHYIAKSQAKALQQMKEVLDEKTAIVLLDFAENYSFIVQDAVQGYHWDNSQATLHPFAIYLIDPATKERKCVSMCVISVDLRHDTASVHAYIHPVLEHLKTNYSHLEHVIYFSDGAASQYKNFKNLSNLCHHHQDFGLSAEWNFFCDKSWKKSM